MNLIIVESPTKARTLSRFLKNSYRVEATMGHIRDLPKSEIGVEVEKDFLPSYVIPKDRQKRIKELKALAADADQVILATDPDREGEAIAWHVSEILSKQDKKKAKEGAGQKTFQRIAFHEITETAIREALAHPRTVDMQLVDAQQARRILDRLVGYKLSPLLWQKLNRRWLSAGRVQSVAVRLIVEREREIAKFESVTYFTIDSSFTAKNGGLTAKLVRKDGKQYESKIQHTLFDGVYSTTLTSIRSEEDAQSIISDFRAPFTVKSVDKRELKKSPPPPFTTSTMQQEAGRKLYFSAKKTMQVAQKLYEEGIITYHRTDSVNLAEKFVTETRNFIASEYGKEYVPDAPRKFQTKSKVAQEAHEAIRPTDPKLMNLANASHPDLNRDHHHLYDLIWKRAVGSQVKEAVFDSTTIVVASANGYDFETQGSVIKFPGYLVVVGRDTNETMLPMVEAGEILALKESVPTSHQTSPPPRYTEATLIKTLEEKDIGRPSTYAPTLSTIQDRNYVVKEDKKMLPTELGNAVTDFLVLHFPEILSLPFTANLENDLDEIANGKKQWVPIIRAFYGDFAKNIDETYKTAQKVKMEVTEMDEACPSCGSPLVLRIGRYGKFIACSTFPKCEYRRQYFEKIEIPCPKCNGPILVKKSKKGKTFYGCSNYPSCTFAAWKKEDIKPAVSTNG